ncbi:MAG: 2-iminoacetate synthase ThiH [Bacteroidales bacterium]
MFSEELEKHNWDEITAQIANKTDDDVKRALSKTSQLNVDDFMALISPAATPYIEQMAALSQRYTRERFGKTISMYIPLYLSNACTNHCVYCGFNHNNKFTRTTLNREQIIEECKAIRKLGAFENLLIVTGEHPAIAGVDYIENALRTARPYFNNLSIEVMPLKQEDYYRLTQSGLNGVICFQETYHRENYKKYHPAGMKSIFEWRVNGYDRMGAAGVHKIGMGVLIGLEEWRTDVTMMAFHLRYLQKHYWKTRYSVNFPRMQPSESGFPPNVIMSDKELAQLTFAFRIFDHDVDISYSTRECPKFRANMLPLGVTSMSAGSKTEPGGYVNAKEALEQFTVSDERTPQEVADEIHALGYEVVWKDWDKIFD